MNMKTRQAMPGVVTLLTAALLLVLWTIAPAPVPIPAELPEDQRAAHRHLPFQGIHNFRDIGGYETVDGRRVRWGVLYRSGALHGATANDLAVLSRLQLSTVVDFRSAFEKEAEPDRLPENAPIEVVELPMLDGDGNAMAQEIMARIEAGDFSDFEPEALMLEANRQFALTFTPQFREFIDTVKTNNGAPVLWHCSAGKDRAGFATAILLRVLGVPRETVVADYALSKQYSLAARAGQLRLLRLAAGEEAADKLAVVMGVEPAWLEAGFEEIDRHWGSFDTYVSEGLGLSDADVVALRNTLLY